MSKPIPPKLQLNKLPRNQGLLSSSSARGPLKETPREKTLRPQSASNTPSSTPRLWTVNPLLSNTRPQSAKRFVNTSGKKTRKREPTGRQSTPQQPIKVSLSQQVDVDGFKNGLRQLINEFINESVCVNENGTIYEPTQYTFADSVKNILTHDAKILLKDYSEVKKTQAGGDKQVTITYDANEPLNVTNIMEQSFTDNNTPDNYKANVICLGSSPEGIYLCILLKLLIPDLEVIILKESEPDNKTRKLKDPTMVLIKTLYNFDVKTDKLDKEITTGVLCHENDTTKENNLEDKLYISSEQTQEPLLNIFPSCFYTSKDEAEYKRIFDLGATNVNIPIQMNMLEYFLTRRAQELGILVLHIGTEELKTRAEQYISIDTVAVFDSTGSSRSLNSKQKMYYAYGKNRLLTKKEPLPKQSTYDNFSGNPYGFYFASKAENQESKVKSGISKYVSKTDIKPKVKEATFQMYPCTQNPITMLTRPENIEVPLIPVGPALRSNHTFNSTYGYYGFADAYIFAMLFKKLYNANKLFITPKDNQQEESEVKKILPELDNDSEQLPPPPNDKSSTLDITVTTRESLPMPPPPPPTEPVKQEEPAMLLITVTENTIPPVVENKEETATLSVNVTETPIPQVETAILSITATETPIPQVETASLSINVTETPIPQVESASLSINVTENPVKQEENAMLSINVTETPIPQEENAMLSVNVIENPVKNETATLSINVTENPVKQEETASLSINVTENPVKQQVTSLNVDEISLELLEKNELNITVEEQPIQNVEIRGATNTDKQDVITAPTVLSPDTAMLAINATETPTEAKDETPPVTKEENKDESSVLSGMFGCSQDALDQSLSKRLQEERDREIRMRNESNSGVNPDAVKQQSSNKEEVMQKWDELKKGIAEPGSNLGSGLSTVASGLVKGTAGLFSKISSATTSKLKTVPYEMLNPSVKYLSIYINPGIEFMSKMLSKYSTSNSVQFNPLVRYSERVINSIPEGKPRTDIYEKLFNNQAFKVMLAETMSSLFGAQTKKTIKEATDAGIVDDNITTTLNTLFATGNVLYINDAPYTVYSYTWNGEWQVDTKVPNSFEYMVHPYQREGLFKYDEMQQAAAQKQLKELPQEILMSKKLRTRLEEPPELDEEPVVKTLTDAIVDAIKPTANRNQHIAIANKEGTSKATRKAVNAGLRRYKAFMPNESNKWDVEVDPYVFTLSFEDRDKLQEFINNSTVNGLKDKYAEMDAARTSYTVLNKDYNNALQQLAQNNEEMDTLLGGLRVTDTNTAIVTGLDKLGLRDKINNQADMSEFIAFISDNVSKHIGTLNEHTSKMHLYKCDKAGLLNNMFTRVNDIQLAINELVGKEAWEEISKSASAEQVKIDEFIKGIENLKTIAANVIRLRETLIYKSNDSRAARELTQTQTEYNEAFKGLQDNKLLLKPWITIVDELCASEFQKIKAANGPAPAFTLKSNDNAITTRLTKLSKLKPFEMIALVDSVVKKIMEEKIQPANTLSQLYIDQTNVQQTLMEVLIQKVEATKDYYSKLGEFLTILKRAFNKKDVRINTLKTAFKADIDMCERITNLSLAGSGSHVPISTQYSESYALELILLYSNCDSKTIDSLKNDMKLDALKHEMNTNVDFWNCIHDPNNKSDLFTDLNKSINEDSTRMEDSNDATKYTKKDIEEFAHNAAFTIIQISEILNLQKIQRLSQELYSIELDVYINQQQEEKRQTCRKDDNCMNTDNLKETTIWIEMKQSCTLLSTEAIQKERTQSIRRKTAIIKELDGIIGNFNKSLLNVFDSNKDSNVETSKVRTLCNAVATSNEQIVVPTLGEFLNKVWKKNEVITNLFQLHIVSSVFMYIQEKIKSLKEILNVKYIENVNFWDVYEKTPDSSSELLDAVATILNSELYLTNSTIASPSCPYFKDGQFDFSNKNTSPGVNDLKNALKKNLKEQLNVLQQVFKIQFTVFNIQYDKDSNTHNMNIVGCDLELVKKDEESFGKSDEDKIVYCAFMILYEEKYYIPYNYKIGSFLYEKPDLKKVSMDYVLTKGCITKDTLLPLVYSFNLTGGAKEETGLPESIEPPQAIAQAEPVIAQAQPVNASNYRIKMENTKESKLSYYIAVDLKLVPGKTLQLTDKLKMACEMNADNVRKDLSRLFGFMYVPKPPLLYTSSKQDKNAKQPLPSATSWMQTKLPDLISSKNYSQVVGDDFVNLMKTKINTSEKFKYAFMNLVIASNEYNEILKTHRIRTEQLNNLITEARYLPVTGGKQSRRANKRAPRGTRKVRV